MHSICPKIIAKLDFFHTMSQMVVAYSALKISYVFLMFSQLCLAYPVYEILEIGKKKTFLEWKITWQYYLTGKNVLAIIY